MQDPRDMPTAADYAWDAARRATDQAKDNAQRLRDLERRVAELEATVFRLTFRCPDCGGEFGVSTRSGNLETWLCDRGHEVSRPRS